MMILNWKNPFGLHDFVKNISVPQGLKSVLIYVHPEIYVWPASSSETQNPVVKTDISTFISPSWPSLAYYIWVYVYYKCPKVWFIHSPEEIDG